MSSKEKQYSDLPQVVQDFLATEKFIKWSDEQAKIFGLAKEKFFSLSEIIKRAILNPDLIKVLAIDIAVVLDTEWKNVEKITAQILGDWFVPLTSLVGDLSEEIKKCGDDPTRFINIKPIWLPELTAEEYIEAALKEWNVNEFQGALRSRLVFILSSLIKKERTVEETKAAFLRSQKVGGMEFSEEVAARAIELINERLQTTPFVISTPTPVVVEVKKPLPVTTEEIKRPVVASVKNFEDIKPPTVRQPTTPTVPNNISIVSTQILPPAPTVSVLSLATPVVEKPAVVSTLVSATPIVPKKMEDFFQKSDEVDIAKASAAVKEKATVIIPSSTREVVEAITEAAGLILPDEDFQKRFSTAIDSRLCGIRDAFATRDLLEKSKEQGGLEIVGVQLVKIMEVLENIVEEKNQSVRREIEKNKKIAQEKKKDQENLPASVNQKVSESHLPEPRVPVLSSGSLTTTTSGRPKVEDISFVRKLAGPIEELQNLSLDEFRRLSSDPFEATIRLKDKIDLLEDQGFGKKLIGIKAWRSSPVSHLYLELSREALITGKSVEEICKVRKINGEEVFSPEEIQAVATLNNDLRF